MQRSHRRANRRRRPRFSTGASMLDGSLRDLRLDGVRPMVGAGLRYNVGGGDRANLALDLSFGDDESGLYARFAEAF